MNIDTSKLPMTVEAVRQEVMKELGTNNVSLSKEEMDQKMIDYMNHIVDSMNHELKELEKNEKIKEKKEISHAYYEVYIAYIKLIIQINPQYFSCMEGGDPYRNYK